jgi:hypothetical protein
MGGPPVYQHGLFELITDHSKNSLDNTFKVEFSEIACGHIRELPEREVFGGMFCRSIQLSSVVVIPF